MAIAIESALPIFADARKPPSSAASGFVRERAALTRNRERRIVEEGAATTIGQIKAVYDFLQRQDDFSPRNAALNAVLSNFVHSVMNKRRRPEIRLVLDDPEIQKLMPSMQRLAARAECAMERFSTAAILGDVDARGLPRYASFDNFIYRGNYEALVRQEIEALRRKGRHPALDKDKQSAAFVGAGPLPMSAILYHKLTGNPVTCIDSDAEACSLGRRLIRYLSRHAPGYEGLDKKVSYVHSTGENHDYVAHPVVFVASLVGGKDAVLLRVVNSCRTGGRVLTRTAEGLSRLLYPAYDCIAGLEEYNIYFLQKTHPDAMTINTSITYTFPPGKMWRRNKIENEMAAASISLGDELAQLQPVRARRWRTGGQILSI